MAPHSLQIDGSVFFGIATRDGGAKGSIVVGLVVVGVVAAGLLLELLVRIVELRFLVKVRHCGYCSERECECVCLLLVYDSLWLDVCFTGSKKQK